MRSSLRSQALAVQNRLAYADRQRSREKHTSRSPPTSPTQARHQGSVVALVGSASWELRAASVCGCSGIRSRASQLPLNAGTEAALSESLRDRTRDGSVTLPPPLKLTRCPSARKVEEMVTTRAVRIRMEKGRRGRGACCVCGGGG